MEKAKLDVNRITNPDTGEFDFIVEHIDPRTKRVIGINPYRMYSSGKETTVYERPVGSGHLYFKSGQPAGQFDYAAYEKAKKVKSANPLQEAIKLGAPHIPWNPPVDGDELLMREGAIKDAKIAELEKELAAIRADKMPKEQVKQAKA